MRQVEKVSPRERREEVKRNLASARKKTMMAFNGFNDPIEEHNWYQTQKNHQRHIEKVKQTKNYISHA